MIEGFLGEDAFRTGIQAYMRKHARANAVADDLWGALAEASSQPVLEVANAWIRQPGYPVVSVSLSGNTLSLSQERFFSDPSAKGDERWPVPLVLRFADERWRARDARCSSASKTLRTELSVTGSVGGCAPMPAPPASTGWPTTRRGFWPLGKTCRRSHRPSALAFWPTSGPWSGPVGPASPTSSTSPWASPTRRDDAVLDELVGKLGYVDARLVDGEATARFRKVVDGLFSPAFQAMGWEPARWRE